MTYQFAPEMREVLRGRFGDLLAGFQEFEKQSALR
jgi:hypothetical protein